jgi:hypothetical protein
MSVASSAATVRRVRPFLAVVLVAALLTACGGEARSSLPEPLAEYGGAPLVVNVWASW